MKRYCLLLACLLSSTVLAGEVVIRPAGLQIEAKYEDASVNKSDTAHQISGFLTITNFAKKNMQFSSKRLYLSVNGMQSATFIDGTAETETVTRDIAPEDGAGIKVYWIFPKPVTLNGKKPKLIWK